MEDVCSALVLAQNEHNPESAFALQAAFADINIYKPACILLVRFRDESAEISIREEAVAYASLTRASRTIW
jgi:hypothetical protein